MNTTSRAILQTLLSDASLVDSERAAVQRLIRGETDTPTAVAPESTKLLTQKAVAELLSVSRVTVWRMTKEAMLHPVEVLPGTWRYRYQEIAAIASNGQTAGV